jgi:subtilisin family serine protease
LNASVRRPCLRRLRTGRSLARVVAALFALLITPILLLGPAWADAGPVTWSARLADAVGTAQLGDGGKGVTVAVLDTWVDGTHPDFGHRVLPGADCATKHVCTPGTPARDKCEPHGTHVAGIVAGSVYGIAPQATILPVRVLASGPSGCTADSQDVARGVRWAAAHHAQIVNLSLGSTYPVEDPGGVLRQAVADVSKAGVVVVVAAGNGQASATDVYGSDALVVAALGPSGRLASYSQRGTGVDIAAPGGDPIDGNCDPDHCIVSTWSDHGYAADAGTSMAAPFVSGAAALLLGQQPHRGRQDVMRTLTSTAVPLKDAGAGRLDVRHALALDAPSAGGRAVQQPASAGQQVATTTPARGGSPAAPARPTAPTGSASRSTASDSAGWSKPVLSLVAAALVVVTGSAVWQVHRGRRESP